jgi:hypothetical protein
VTSVTVVAQDGAQRVLPETAYGYDTVSQTLTVQRSAINPKDATLRIAITSDCRPIPR